MRRMHARDEQGRVQGGLSDAIRARLLERETIVLHVVINGGAFCYLAEGRRCVPCSLLPIEALR